MTPRRGGIQEKPDWDGLQAGFFDFLSHATILSKDEGRVQLEMYDAQRYFFDCVFDGLRHDIHWFVCGKGRQVGITTGCLLFDVFCTGTILDLQAGFVADSDTNKEKFRALLKDMLQNLPDSHALPIAKGGDNRNFLKLTNGNMLDYLVAGTKAGQGTLGRSRALNFLHATECRSYGDPVALEAFKDTLSEWFPWRLYLWETTGKGYNLFYDLWDEAVGDTLTKQTIFVTWWRKRSYSYASGTPLFERYGWPDRSPDELEAEKIVLRDYGHQITDEQWAWYRHRADPIARAEERDTLSETNDEREELVTQEHPHFPEQMFRGTGSPFIPNEYLAPAMERAQNLVFRGYQYHLGDAVEAMRLTTTKFLKYAQLKVWEPPSPIGTYIIGADTAFGISERGNAFCAQIVRCFADRMVQVAEFNDPNIQPFQFAWVLFHLCGWYGLCRYVMELNASGEAVWTEMRNLKRQVEEGKLLPPTFAPEDLTPLPLADPDQPPANDPRRAYEHVTQYLYRRSDTLGGSGYNYHMRTTLENKFTFMVQFGDRFMLNEFTINSVRALEEMKRLRKDGRSIEGEGKARDDRPITLGLVTRVYLDDERKKLVARNATYATEMQREADGVGQDSVQARYMQLIMQQAFAAKGTARRQARRTERRQRWNW
jgi:hypothetical protein